VLKDSTLSPDIEEFRGLKKEGGIGREKELLEKNPLTILHFWHAGKKERKRLGRKGRSGGGAGECGFVWVKNSAADSFAPCKGGKTFEIPAIDLCADCG